MKNSEASKGIRDFVTFNAEFPDDAVWDEQGNSVVPAGRTIAEHIRNRLDEQGLHCSLVRQHEFYGWAFDGAARGGGVRILLTAAEGGWLIQLERNISLASWLFGATDTEMLNVIQKAIHDALSGDKQFADVLWYMKRDYESGENGRACRSPY